MTMNQDPQPPSNLKIHCDNASSLVQSYMDSELTEAQAAPLREHFLDCPACRELAKNDGMIASFSRALTEGLSAQQSDAEFDAMLADAIAKIYDCSKA